MRNGSGIFPRHGKTRLSSRVHGTRRLRRRLELCGEFPAHDASRSNSRFCRLSPRRPSRPCIVRGRDQTFPCTRSSRNYTSVLCTHFARRRCSRRLPYRTRDLSLLLWSLLCSPCFSDCWTAAPRFSRAKTFVKIAALGLRWPYTVNVASRASSGSNPIAMSSRQEPRGSSSLPEYQRQRDD
jgi:hypothetical protein